MKRGCPCSGRHETHSRLLETEFDFIRRRGRGKKEVVVGRIRFIRLPFSPSSLFPRRRNGEMERSAPLEMEGALSVDQEGGAGTKDPPWTG